MRYQIVGDSLPALIVDLEAGEYLQTEGGAMSWMTPNLKMETSSGGVGKMFGRAFSGESIFQNRYTAEGGPGQIAISSSFPGSIRAYQINQGQGLILQKSAYLASTAGVELQAFLNKKVGTGIFGGEGFVLQKVTGEGTVFVEIDGHAVEYVLEAGQQMVLDTGHLAIMDETCTMEIKSVPGLKNKLLGGEGLFNTVVTGPGKLVIQTMPISRFAGLIVPYVSK